MFETFLWLTALDFAHTSRRNHINYLLASNRDVLTRCYMKTLTHSRLQIAGLSLCTFILARTPLRAQVLDRLPPHSRKRLRCLSDLLFLALCSYVRTHPSSSILFVKENIRLSHLCLRSACRYTQETKSEHART